MPALATILVVALEIPADAVTAVVIGVALTLPLTAAAAPEGKAAQAAKATTLNASFIVHRASNVPR